MPRHALIVAGPTASGKSALAIALAERCNGTIINADSMQVYRELRIITARPSPEDCARVPHRLYGVLSAAERGNVGWWRARALHEIDEAHASGRLPILTGGSGLYFAALTEGLSEIPDAGQNARSEARALLREIGPAALHARLALVDPATAATLRPADSQRVARAWEVWRGTGHGLTAWHARASGGPALRFTALLLDPPREELRGAIVTRCTSMLQDGAVEEVRALLALGLDAALPAMRAHGVVELGAYLLGEVSLAAAESRVQSATIQFAKRQATWFRHHTLGDQLYKINARFTDLVQFSERKLKDIVAFVQTAR